MAGDGPITVWCTCGKKLKAPAESAGKKARCPACGAVVRLTAGEPGAAVAGIGSGGKVASTAADKNTSKTIPRTTKSARARTAPADAPARATAAPNDFSGAADDDGLGALHELNEQAKTAAMVPDGPMCPSCLSKMEDHAVLCANCGYDTRTGKALSITREAPSKGQAANAWSKGKSRPVDATAPRGLFIVGLLVAAGIGIVCCILWLVVLYVIGYFLSIFIAAGLGWVVGLGMRLGQKGYSRRGGIAAATIAALAISGPHLLGMVLLMCIADHGHLAEIGISVFSPLLFISMAVGLGAAYKAANGAGL